MAKIPQDPEAQPPQQTSGGSRLSTFANRWAGKLKLPEPDPNDARLTYLIEKYERNRK